jgi:amino acid transporter
MAFAVPLVVSTYVLPLAICVAALPEDQAWGAGFFIQAGKNLGGPALQAWILAASAVSNVGQYLSEQAANAYQLLGMAELGHLPAFFAYRSRHGTPTVGILVTYVLVLFLALFDMDDLMTMLNGVYCLAELIEFAAFLKLRWKHPDLERPYRMPLGLAGCVVLLFGPTAMCILLLVFPYYNGDWQTAIFVLGSAALGPVLYAVVILCRRRWPSSFLRSALEDAREPMFNASEASTNNG